MLRLALPLLLGLLLAACSDPEKAWKLAEREDTTEGYLQFLAQHPDGAYAERARQRMVALRERRSWERAEYRDRLDVYRRFLDNHPDGEFAERARARIAELQRDAAWEAAEESEDLQVLESFVARFPDAPQAAKARRLIATLTVEVAEAPPAPPREPPGEFRIQLGAFRTAAAAEAELRRLVARFPDTLAGPVRIDTPEVTGGRWFLLRSSPMTGPKARAACRALATAGQDCFVVNREPDAAAPR